MTALTLDLDQDTGTGTTLQIHPVAEMFKTKQQLFATAVSTYKRSSIKSLAVDWAFHRLYYYLIYNYCAPSYNLSVAPVISDRLLEINVKDSEQYDCITLRPWCPGNKVYVINGDTRHIILRSLLLRLKKKTNPYTGEPIKTVQPAVIVSGTIADQVNGMIRGRQMYMTADIIADYLTSSRTVHVPLIDSPQVSNVPIAELETLFIQFRKTFVTYLREHKHKHKNKHCATAKRCIQLHCLLFLEHMQVLEQPGQLEFALRLSSKLRHLRLYTVFTSHYYQYRCQTGLNGSCNLLMNRYPHPLALVVKSVCPK